MTSPTPVSSQESAEPTLGLSVPAGAPSASRRSTPTPAPSSQSDGQESRTSVTSWRSLAQNQRGELRTSDVAMQLTAGGGKPGQGYPAIVRLPSSGPAASPARTSVSPESEPVSPESAASSLSRSSPLWSDIDLPPSSSRTYRDSSPVMAGATWRGSSVRWSNSGMAWRTGCSTLSTSECPSADDGYSSSVCEAIPTTLTDVLQPSAPPRFFLSARAAAGILRRATKRGRELPMELGLALTALSQTGQPPLGRLARQQDTTATPSEHRTQTVDTFRLATPPTGLGQSPLEPEATTTLPPLTATNSSVSSVRRLTPTETDLLMGWPPGHTIVHNWKRRDR